MDAQTRTQTADLYSSESGTSTGGRKDTSYTLTGNVVDGSPGCEARYGVLTDRLYGGNISIDAANLITVSKGVDDQFWNVTITTPNGSVIDEYQVQTLGKHFYCDMKGL